jgi:hypothetical protein
MTPSYQRLIETVKAQDWDRAEGQVADILDQKLAEVLVREQQRVGETILKEAVPGTDGTPNPFGTTGAPWSSRTDTIPTNYLSRAGHDQWVLMHQGSPLNVPTSLERVRKVAAQYNIPLRGIPVWEKRRFTPLKEWIDPRPPCKLCGQPEGSHAAFPTKADCTYAPSKGWTPLSQDDAKRFGFDKLSGAKLPRDIYQKIASVRESVITEAKITVDMIDNAIGATLDALADRWQEEQEYENINSYGQALDKGLQSIGMRRVRMTKSPFGVVAATAGGSQAHIYVKGDRIFVVKV